MITDFMIEVPDYNAPRINPPIGGWYASEQDYMHPTMLVLDLGSDDYPNTVSDDRFDYPTVAVKQIPSIREVFTKKYAVYPRYFKGYRFVSYETLHHEFYMIVVWVRKA